jgi:recombination protein RecT
MSTELVLKKENFAAIKEDWLKQSGTNEQAFYKEVSFAIQIINGNQYMQSCSQQSVLKAVMNVAQIGLTLNPVLKYAYIVPRYNKKKGCLEAVLDCGYQGLAKLLTDSGSVKSISANIIYDGDEIEIDLASDEKVKKHVPNFLCGKKRSSKVIGVYSLAVLHDGSKHIELLSEEEVHEVRERSESFISFKNGKTKSCIWDSDYPEMCRKTAIKRHFKYLPKSDNMEAVQKALEVENQANGYKISDSQISYIDSLLHSSSIDETKKKIIENEMFDYDSIQASNCIEYLKENQIESLREQFERKIK